eukprot:20682-Heterococcus_DN1.PRE.3
MQKKDTKKFKEEFYPEFGHFLKEGVCQDYKFQCAIELLVTLYAYMLQSSVPDFRVTRSTCRLIVLHSIKQPDIAKLLYFESSKSQPEVLVSLDEYISRLSPEKKEIYYLNAPNRQLAGYRITCMCAQIAVVVNAHFEGTVVAACLSTSKSSPYYETFKKNDIECLFVYNTIDDFVMSNLSEYNGRKIVSAEKDDFDLGTANKDDASDAKGDALSEAESKELCDYIKSTLSDKVMEVKITSRLDDSPAIVSSHESAAYRRMTRYVEMQSSGGAKVLPKQKMEVNPKHPIMIGLLKIKQTQPDLAHMVAEQ